MAPSEAILRFAEEPDYEGPEPSPPGRRFIRPNFTLVLSPAPTQSTLSRVRTTAAELDATIAEVRAILREYGYVACGWHLGPSCQPLDLAKLLGERGFVPASEPPFEPHFTAMALTRPPPEGASGPGVEARLVQSLDEYVRALRAGLESIGESADAIAKWVDAAPGMWEGEMGIAKMAHVAFADGHIAGLGLVIPGPAANLLGGGAVLEAYRGRGVYRGLVASRWRAAVATGKPALAVHAGAMSRPILERCGFEEVCRIDVLVDKAIG